MCQCMEGDINCTIKTCMECPDMGLHPMKQLKDAALGVNIHRICCHCLMGYVAW